MKGKYSFPTLKRTLPALLLNAISFLVNGEKIIEGSTFARGMELESPELKPLISPVRQPCKALWRGLATDSPTRSEALICSAGAKGLALNFCNRNRKYTMEITRSVIE